MKYTRSGNHDLSAIKSDGTVVSPDKDGLLTLAAATYYIELGSTDAAMCEEVVDISTHMKWSAALAGTATFEWTNFPATRSSMGQGGADVSSIDATAGNWVQDNDATGDKISPVVGAGNSIANLTVTLGGTNAGAVGIQLKERSARRYRSKLVISAGGTLRFSAHGKIGT